MFSSPTYCFVQKTDTLNSSRWLLLFIVVINLILISKQQQYVSRSDF
jgi:hypothetical protein